jgi:hypothetical protein
LSKTKKLEEELERKVSTYVEITGAALRQACISTTLSRKEKKLAQAFKDMATRYYQDAHYFKERGDLLNALAALSYSHAWLDAGALAGFFDVRDSKLFILPKQG